MRSFTAIAVPLLVLSTFAKNDKGKESCSFSTSCRHEIEVLTANEGSECIGEEKITSCHREKK